MTEQASITVNSAELIKRSADAISEDSKAKIAQELPLSRCELDGSEEVCSGECDEEDIIKGEKIFSKLQIDYETPLLNTSMTPKIHFIVPTSKQDWAFDACSENPDSVQYKISEWCTDRIDDYEDRGLGETFTCSVTSMPINMMDMEVMRQRKNRVLVLPFFLWIEDLRSDDVESVLDELVPQLLDGQVTREELVKTHPNLTEANEKSFVFICSHMTRDKRCGLTAPYMKRVCDAILKEHGLYRDASDDTPNGCRVSFINHLGGHKFAGNVQIYLREPRTMIWLGRVTPKYLPTIFDYLILPETPTLPLPDHVRCIRKYDQW